MLPPTAMEKTAISSAFMLDVLIFAWGVFKVGHSPHHRRTGDRQATRHNDRAVAER
jgi:hypothetical protein